MAERYKLKFDNLYTVTDDGYLEVPLDPNKVLLKSTEEGVTGGYYDGAGEWHEFGGGGGDSIKTCSITIVNNSTKELNCYGSAFFPNSTILFSGDGVTSEELAVPSNETKTFKLPYTYPVYDASDNTYTGGVIDWGADYITFTNTEKENCVFIAPDNNGPAFGVTDTTKDCSITITVADE